MHPIRSGLALFALAVTAPLSAQNPRLVADVNPLRKSSSPSFSVVIEPWVYFAADDGKHGVELWRTDGTSAGTTLVKDIQSGPASSWPSYPAKTAGGSFVFSAYTAPSGTELWISDGTARGTRQLKEIRSGFLGGKPRDMKRIGDWVYFAADDGSSGNDLWRTNGTAAATALFKNLNFGSFDSHPSEFTAVPGTGKFVFRATNGLGAEIWISDHTPPGTMLLADIRPGAMGSAPSWFTPLGNVVLFGAGTRAAGPELWKTDGTTAGTVQVKDIYPGSVGSGPSFLSNHNDEFVLFAASTAATGSELWRSDGTAAGTSLVKDIVPGTPGSLPRHVTPFGSRLSYFAADDRTTGVELWETDGTRAGTKRTADIQPGARGSSPRMVSEGYEFRFERHGRMLFFAADDGKTGRELWMYDAGARAHRHGSSCGAAPHVPSLTAADPVLGNTQRIETRGVQPGAVGVSVLGVPAATPAAVGNGCFAYFDLAQFFLVFDAWAQSGGTTRSLTVRLPNDAGLVGLRAELQTVVLLTAAPGGRSWSNGVVEIFDAR